MRQSAFMGKHLAKIAHVDPDAAYRALDEMRGYSRHLAGINAWPACFVRVGYSQRREFTTPRHATLVGPKGSR
jgi:hypothetical protein